MGTGFKVLLGEHLQRLTNIPTFIVCKTGIYPGVTYPHSVSAEQNLQIPVYLRRGIVGYDYDSPERGPV